MFCVKKPCSISVLYCNTVGLSRIRIFFFVNKKHKPSLSLPSLGFSLSLCAAEEELEYMDTEGPVLCWDSLGLPDLDCDEKPGWISSSSLAGELIQPGPQEV